MEDLGNETSQCHLHLQNIEAMTAKLKCVIRNTKRVFILCFFLSSGCVCIFFSVLPKKSPQLPSLLQRKPCCSVALSLFGNAEKAAVSPYNISFCGQCWTVGVRVVLQTTEELQSAGCVQSGAEVQIWKCTLLTSCVGWSFIVTNKSVSDYRRSSGMRTEMLNPSCACSFL